MLHEIMMEIENEVGLERGAETMLEVTLHCDKKFTICSQGTHLKSKE